MDEKIIKVTDKGQVSLPMVVREALQIYPGNSLLLSRSDDVIILKKVRDDDFSDLLKHSEKVLEKLWDNKEDEIWYDF